MITITVAAIPFLFALLAFFIFMFAFAISADRDYWIIPLCDIGIAVVVYFMLYGIFAACGCL